jgi:hypothetical protein
MCSLGSACSGRAQTQQQHIELQSKIITLFKKNAARKLDKRVDMDKQRKSIVENTEFDSHVTKLTIMSCNDDIGDYTPRLKVPRIPWDNREHSTSRIE